MAPMTEIKVLLIDDHVLFRSGLKFLLETQADFNVVGEGSNGLEAIELTQQLKPDVILLDLDMPLVGGREVLPRLLEITPCPAIFVLTVSEDSNDLTESMRLGARGYLLKNIETDFLLDSIRRGLEGDNVLSPEMTSKLIQQLRSPKPEKADLSYSSLTTREKEILVQLASGISNKEIALMLDLKESTVKVHVQNILRKLSLKSRVQAAIYAVEHGYDKL